MNLKRQIILAAMAICYGFAAPSGEELMQKHCISCHMASNLSAEKVKHMVAPPMWGVARHLKKSIKSKEEYIDFVSDYILNPSKEKSRFAKEAIDRFGLMPSMKGSITENEVKAIAEYLYNTY